MEENINENDLINLITLDKSNQEIAEKIIKEDNLDNLKDLTHLFNLNQTKKNVIRVMKFNSLLDKVSDQMLERFEKCPGEFSNTDLINYLNVTQSAIDRANKSIALVDEAPAIQINQVNIDTKPELSRESKQKIMEAVQALINKSQAMQEQEVLEAEIIEDKKGDDDDSI